MTSADLRVAFAAYERRVRISNYKVGCLMAFIFVPAGASLDYFVYRNDLTEFIQLRFLCSALLALIWGLLHSKAGIKIYRVLGFFVAFLPMAFISWMIYKTDGPNSPYYAGLNLVMLGAALLLRWTFWDSVLACFFSLLSYLAACFLNGQPSVSGTFFNNVYFLIVTGCFIITGSWFYNRIRFREFALRYELDRNKQELERTNRKLIELDRLKSRFFANISHEMRTPLTLLLSPLETLLHRYGNTLNDNVREQLLLMQTSGLRLLKLINDLLELIRLEAGRLEIKSEPLYVDEFVHGLASAIRQMAENKRIRLETHVAIESKAILTDRDKLEKIVLNLLFNALKFTPPDGQIRLRAEKQGDDFVLVVSDTGIGIAEKNLPFVFDRFWQADTSSKRKFQGVGIGLALVKELSEMMRGKVTVQSQEGKGTTFTVRLPYQKADVPPRRETTPPVPPSDKADMSEEWLANLYRRAEFFPAMAAARESVKPVELTGRRPTVLIADDEPDMRRFLRAELEEDYDLVETVNGLEALEKAQTFRPDIILLDMMMPEMDGLEVCRELRRREATLKTPVILLTARADEETKYDALEMGANDFLAKPFSSHELQARIKNLIESHHYQRKLTTQNKALSTAIEQIKETEMQLVQSEKLASLGRLSAGIIHEINNPLNFTLTGLFALRNKSRQLPAAERAEYEEILNDVEEGIKRVRDIVSDLRTFTHPGGSSGEIVEVDDTVEAALRFLSGEWRGRIQIEQNLPVGQVVWANRNKLIHVLVNLLQNSIDSLTEKKFKEEVPTIQIEGRIEGDRSFIVVRDNGMGVDPKLMDKIFDPFFTTKEIGKGMGLGLSICYRILQGYGGKVSVKSEPGRYCEFTIELLTKEKPAELETQHGEPLRL